MQTSCPASTLLCLCTQPCPSLSASSKGEPGAALDLPCWCYGHTAFFKPGLVPEGPISHVLCCSPRVEVMASVALNLSNGLGSHFVLASLDS